MSKNISVALQDDLVPKVEAENKKRKIRSTSKTVNILIEEYFENIEREKRILENANNLQVGGARNHSVGINYNKKRLSRKELKENKEKFEPLLKELGAKFIKKGIYELNEFICYPSTGKAMNKKDRNIRMELQDFISKQNNNE